MTARPATSMPLNAWLDSLRATRDGLVSASGFQQWAARFPLTRPIARRRARRLFDLCAGFVYSQILLACVKLRLFDALADGPGTAAALAERLQLSVDATERLLRAACALDLVRRHGRDTFALGPLGAPLRGNTGIAAMVEHHVMLYEDLRDPVGLLRGAPGSTRTAAFWPYAGSARPAGLGVQDVAGYTDLMAASQRMIAATLLDTYSLRRHRCLLDVGGGDGSFALAAGQRWPHLRLITFDLPAVAAQARARFAAAGLAARAVALGGNFLTDRLPGGADVAVLVRIVHDHDDESAVNLLRAVRRVLPAGGVVLIAEPLARHGGAAQVGDAYFGFYLLAMGKGRPRSAGEVVRLLVQAGFDRPRLLRSPMPLLADVLMATAPGPSARSLAE